MGVQLKRAYEAPAETDGYRVLVDRLWPRGVSHEQVRLDEWARQLAPSRELRQWFGHDPARFAEFRRRYRVELKAEETKLQELRARAHHGDTHPRLRSPRYGTQRCRRARGTSRSRG